MKAKNVLFAALVAGASAGAECGISEGDLEDAFNVFVSDFIEEGAV